MNCNTTHYRANSSSVPGDPTAERGAGKTTRMNGVGGPVGEASRPSTAAQDTLSLSQLRDTGAEAAAIERQGYGGSAAHPLVVRDGNGQAGNDTFTALDASRTPPSPTWLHAGAHRAEAGYLDPALGWVAVRADAIGSGVHAALVPDSAQAAQVLGSHLSALNTYLAEHHGQHASVTLATLQDGRQGAGPDQRNGAGDGSAGRGGAPQGEEDFGGGQAPSSSPSPIRPGAIEGLPGTMAANEPLRITAGNYISVMA